MKKSKQDKATFSQKLKKVQDDDDDKRKAQQQQDSLIEMMKLQMREVQERADREVEEALQRQQSVSSVSTDPEIYELRDEIEKLENKLDEMMNQLDDKENENRRLGEFEAGTIRLLTRIQRRRSLITVCGKGNSTQELKYEGLSHDVTAAVALHSLHVRFSILYISQLFSFSKPLLRNLIPG